MLTFLTCTPKEEKDQPTPIYHSPIASLWATHSSFAIYIYISKIASTHTLTEQLLSYILGAASAAEDREAREREREQ